MKPAVKDIAWAVGVVVVMAAAFFSGALTEAGVVAAECERDGRATIAFKTFVCEREQR